MVFNDRPTYQDRHARISSWPRETISTQRPNAFAQTRLLDQTLPCSRTASHTYEGLIGRHLSCVSVAARFGYTPRMRALMFVCLFLAIPAVAQDAFSLGKSSVSDVLEKYTLNPLVRLPDTQKPLPSTGKWSMRTARPESCPHDDTPCAGVVYAVPEAHALCEWTVVPQQGAAAPAFLDQNEDASRYFLRLLPASDLASLVVTSPQPVYPPIARAAHVSGSVVVRLVISEKGSTSLVTAVSGPAMLLAATTDAAKKWTFRPLQVGKESAAFTVDINATFTLPSNLPSCTRANPCATLPDGTVTMRP